MTAMPSTPAFFTILTSEPRGFNALRKDFDMKALRISSPLNLHAYTKENVSEHIREGLLFHKKMGFAGVDFAMGLLDLDSNAWKY